MDLTDYDLVASRIDTIDHHLAWLDARQIDQEERTSCLTQERFALTARLHQIELRYGYDAAMLDS